MKIDNAVDAVESILQRHEFSDCAKIVTEVQIAGRLYAGKNAFLERHCPSSVAAEPCHAGGARRKALSSSLACGCSQVFDLGHAEQLQRGEINCDAEHDQRNEAG